MSDLVVYSLDDKKERKYNPDNFDDDIDCGFIYFSKDIINELKKHFFIFCYYMVDKSGNFYLIDDLEDKIMFFEGEYNRIKSAINNDLIRYNIRIEIKDYLPISRFMILKEFYLDWNAHEKSGYFYELAGCIWKKIEPTNLIGKCVLNPNNYKEFCDSINNLVSVTNFPYQTLNLQKDFQELIHSAIEEIFIEFSAEDIYIYFEQICKIVLYYLKGELNNG